MLHTWVQIKTGSSAIEQYKNCIKFTHAAPLFVAVTVKVHEGAMAQDTAERTLSWPSQSPIEKGRPGGGEEKAQVIVVPTLVVAPSRAGPTRVPVGDLSTTVRLIAQLESTGASIV